LTETVENCNFLRKYFIILCAMQPIFIAGRATESRQGRWRAFYGRRCRFLGVDPAVKEALAGEKV
jgi:hypothetical protein